MAALYVEVPLPLHRQTTNLPRLRAAAALMDRLGGRVAFDYVDWLAGQPRPRRVAALSRMWLRGQVTERAADRVMRALDGAR